MFFNVILPLMLTVLMVAAIVAVLARDLYRWCSGRVWLRLAVLFRDAATIRAALDASPHLADDPEALFSAIFHEKDEALALLLERGADVRRPLEWGGAALHIAARYGTPAGVRAVLAHGADIDQDCRGTPLYWAADQGRLDVVELLLERGANPSLVAVEKIGLSAFKPKFATPGEFEVIRKRLVEAQRKGGSPAGS